MSLRVRRRGAQLLPGSWLPVTAAFLATLCSHLSITRAHSAVIGTNVESAPLTSARVSGLPEWQKYLDKSSLQRKADQLFLAEEMKAAKVQRSTAPKVGRNKLRLDQSDEWYSGTEALRIASNVISFQTPAGGWCKNTDFVSAPRKEGEMFGAETGSVHLSEGDFDSDSTDRWSYVGTFDNGATITELRFLARVISARQDETGTLKDSFEKGLNYVLNAQYPNGGWPQVYPLQGGYHDAITLNDDALARIMNFLMEVDGANGSFKFVRNDLRGKAQAAWKKGVQCLMAAQIKEGDRLTVWAQQHDPLNLKPVSARNYEMPAQGAAESAEIVLFLMRLPEPDAAVVRSVHAAYEWFNKTRIMDRKFTNTGSEGRKLIDAPGEGPLWARFYQLGTDKPIFGERDKFIHDDVNEISKERRKGYSWFTDKPKRVLQHYKRWAQKHPQT